MKKLFSILILLLFTGTTAFANPLAKASSTNNSFLGMWTFDIDGGGIGYLKVHKEQGFLDAEMLWVGGSVVPVSNVYLLDENNLVVTRTRETAKNKGSKEERKHTITYTLNLKRKGDQITGSMTQPKDDGTGVTIKTVKGKRLVAVGSAPDLSLVKYGKAIKLFNGKNMKGWRLLDASKKLGFSVVDGTLSNNPIQPEHGEHISYGNLRTIKEFTDFNLKLEVNVPKGNNSGVFLRGIYEIQVVDSYGQALDPHNMGALYSRITPSEAAEKPAGEWQTMDITLVDRHVTVILNGKTIIDNQAVDGPTGGAMSSDVFAPGPIYLQGDHSKVAYRNIVLKPVK